MDKLVLYPMIGEDVALHHEQLEAFQSHFDCVTFDWLGELKKEKRDRPNIRRRPVSVRNSRIINENSQPVITREHALRNVHRRFIKLLEDVRPKYCFMQIQGESNMDVETMKHMASLTKIINWTGDVRGHSEWYDWFAEIGKHIHLTLFTNETDVNILRKRGCVADYFQIGYDSGTYTRKKAVNAWPKIVFCANCFDEFPLSSYRKDVVMALRSHFGSDFGIYGVGWDKYGIQTRHINSSEESDAYNAAKLAISVSHFSYDRYYSDRLMRIMGSECLPMSHYFPHYEKDFKDRHDIVIFNDIDELISLCEYYLTHGEERQVIATNAYETAKASCTWTYRCKELIQILNKYEN